MAAADVYSSRLAFVGLLADDLTRQVLRVDRMAVSLESDSRPALRTDDGHVAFVGVEPSATDYHIRLGGPSYQARTVAKALPTLRACR